jgi:hypothetical protein
MPAPPGDALVASPSGGAATSPRVSIGLSVTFDRIAALTVARSCAWLSVPVQPQAACEKDQRLLPGSGRSMPTAVWSADN